MSNVKMHVRHQNERASLFLYNLYKISMNNIIIEQFKLLIEQIEAEHLIAQMENNLKEIETYKFKLQAMKKILGIIKKLNFEIKSENDLKGIPGIGKRTIRRVSEILETGKLSEIQEKYQKHKINSIRELTRIIGIGPKIAKKLVLEHNITSIEDLKKAIATNKIKVSNTIILGLKYYKKVKGSIPREEIQETEKYLKSIAHKIDPNLTIIICGSYRRGKSTSNDIDLLLYYPDTKNNLKPYMQLFIDLLIKERFLIDSIYTAYRMKYMGFYQYKSFPIRRIDIRFFSYESLPAAKLYFTGPFELNRIMRTEAKKRNMILNEYGIYKLSGDKIPVSSEEDIFNILGMKYLSPEEREEFNIGKQKLMDDK